MSFSPKISVVVTLITVGWLISVLTGGFFASEATRDIFYIFTSWENLLEKVDLRLAFSLVFYKAVNSVTLSYSDL